MPVILALGRWRQEDKVFMTSLVHRKFRASLGYTKPSLKKKKKSERFYLKSVAFLLKDVM